ncbi:hypothetical protein BX600DRAFT_221682 [Xylariales sp. PMI_506]|nr:hypothetical protein BX600DRAFT_221682 [Xylariales sp. PMI_506]
MAPVPIEQAPSYVPLALTAIHLGLIFYLTYAVGTSLYTSYKFLAPSQDTRRRLAQRSKLVPTFLVLSGVSLLVSAVSFISYASLSYRVWADERGIELPQRLFGKNGLLPDGKNASHLYLASWLSDTPLYRDALEIIAEKARRFWWGQQVDLATVSWSFLLSIEGHRRQIPLLPAFMALAHLVNLSFAQNLFFVALLLTPAPLIVGNTPLELPVLPLPSAGRARITSYLASSKPQNWCPHPMLYIVALFPNFVAIFLMPFAADTPSFPTIILLSRLSNFLPLIIPRVVPITWGTVYSNPHKAYSSITTIFRVISLLSFGLHIKASALGLAYNTPGSHYHRHSRLLPWDTEQRSMWERSTTAIGKVLGSTADHPVVAAVGWDALLCTLSLGFWAAARFTDVHKTLASIIPFYSQFGVNAVGTETEASHEHGHTLPSAVTTGVKSENSPGLAATTHQRHRRGRSSVTSIASSAVSDDTHGSQPKQGKGTIKSKDRKNKSATPDTKEDKTYQPTLAEERQLVEGDALPVTDTPDWESAALAWGLVAFGGLGVATAGVYGAECISR